MFAYVLKNGRYHKTEKAALNNTKTTVYTIIKCSRIKKYIWDK